MALLERVPMVASFWKMKLARISLGYQVGINVWLHVWFCQVGSVKSPWIVFKWGLKTISTLESGMFLVFEPEEEGRMNLHTSLLLFFLKNTHCFLSGTS